MASKILLEYVFLGRRRTQADDRGVLERTEADRHNIGAVDSGAQKVNVTFPRHRDEASRHRRAFERQLVDTFERATRGIARHEGRGLVPRIRNVLAQNIEAVIVVDFQKLHRAELVGHAQSELPDRLMAVHGLDFDTNAAVALAGRNDVGNHRSLASGCYVLPLTLPPFCNHGGTGILVQQISRTSWRLRTHLGERGDGNRVVDGAPRDNLLESNFATADAAGGLFAGGLERTDRSIPHQDVAFANDEIVGLDIRGHLQNARIAARLLRIEAENAAVDLVEHEQIAVRIRRQRLRAGQFDVFNGGSDTDCGGGVTGIELPHQGVGSHGGGRA